MPSESYESQSVEFASESQSALSLFPSKSESCPFTTGPLRRIWPVPLAGPLADPTHHQSLLSPLSYCNVQLKIPENHDVPTAD